MKNKKSIIIYLCYGINLILFGLLYFNKRINGSGRVDLCKINEIEKSKRNLLSNGVYPNIKNQKLFDITKYLQENIQLIVVGIIIITVIIGIIYLLIETIKYKKSIVSNLLLALILIIFGGYNFIMFSIGRCNYNNSKYNIGCDYKCPNSILIKSFGTW